MSAEPIKEDSGTEPGFQGRKWLGIHFRCCHVYGRLYRDDAGQAYVGQCPRCAAPVTVAICKSGTNRRFFEAS